MLLMSSRGRRRRNPGSSDLAATVCFARCPHGRRPHLRDAGLDPGSALRAVRDDVKRRCAMSGMTGRFGAAQYAGQRRLTVQACCRARAPAHWPA